MQNVVAIKVMEFSVAGKQKDKQIVDITQEFSIMSQIRDEHVIKLFGIIAEPQICMVRTILAHGWLCLSNFFV